MRDALEVLPIRGIGRIQPDSDLAEAIVTAAPWLRDGDVMVVTSKIVSKSEGQLVDLPPDGPERDAAREQILTEQTARPVARRGGVRIVSTHHGFVMASAGIDNSNVDRSQLVLLPKDPDGSARALRAALAERYGLDVAVIISDTMGRPWRMGLTDVALGAAGIAPIRDHRGEIDPYGNELQITQMAIIDELSAAAELVKGKCDEVPVAVIRGYLERPTPEDGPGAAALVRDSAEDLFSLGTAEARSAGLWAAATLSEGGGEVPATPEDLARILATVPLAPTTVARTVPGNRIRCTTSADLVALGMDVHRVRCALAAEGIASSLEPDPDGVTIVA